MRAVRTRWAIVTVAAAGVVAGAAALALHGTPAGAVASADGSFTPLPPSRVLNTRAGIGAAQQPVPAHGTVVLQVGGRGGVPSSGVGAVVLNVTVTGPTAGGYLTVWNTDIARPSASNLNFVTAQTVANLVTTKVDPTGRVSLYNGSPGTVQLVADVSGYYRSGAAAGPGMFTPLTPLRVLNTRDGTGAPKAAVAPGQELKVTVDGTSPIPATGVSAVVLNLTVTGTTAGGYITAWGDGPRPASSNLNFGPGQTVPNLVVAPVDAGGRVHLYNGSPHSVQLIADVSGYFLAGGPLQSGGLSPVPATRLLDTRTAGSGGALPSHGTRTLTVAGKAWVLPSGVAAVVLNVTVTEPTAGGFLTVWDQGTTPTASTLNFSAHGTVANLAMVALSPSGTVSIYNGSPGSTHVIVDVAGFVLGADRPGQPPAAATGRYVRNITDGGSADVTTMHNEGCTDAQGATGAGPYLHLLHIGAQSQHFPLSAAHPGVALTGFSNPDPDTNPRLTYPQLVAALEGYLDGYVSCHTGSANVTVAIGTNNDGDWQTYTAAKKGADWATEVIEPLRAYVAGDSWLHVAGADDIEAGFSSSETDAEHWVTAFVGKTSANLVQDGSLDNCPLGFQTGGPVSCGPVPDDNDPPVTKTWTQAQYLQLDHDLAPSRITVLPQIYLPLQAWQWANLVAASSGQLTIPAVLTEHAADDSEFTPSQGWGALWDALSTRSGAVAPTMSVDLRSDYPPSTPAAARATRATLPNG